MPMDKESGFFKLVAKSQCHQGIGQLVKLLWKVTNTCCAVFIFQPCCCFLCAPLSCPEARQAPGGLPKQTRTINMGCRCCCMGHMPKKFPQGVEGCSSWSMSPFFLFFFLLVTQSSLSTFALSISTDRSACCLQIIVSVLVFKCSQHHPEEFNPSGADGEIAAFITTRCRTSLFHSHLDK